MRTNEFGQAIGDALPDFTPGRLPAIERIFIRSTGQPPQQICGPIYSMALPTMKLSGIACWMIS